MGDPDQRGAVVAGEFLHLGEDLRLDGDVERGGGFVGDDEVGSVEQGDGDGDALAHAAGELVRVGGEALLGRGDADHAQRVARAGTGFGVGDIGVGVDGFHHLGVDAQDRIERHHRVLENHRDAVAAKLALFGFIERGDVAALKQDLPGGDAAGGVDQADEGKAGDGFARAGLADEAKDLAAIDMEGDAVNRLHHAGAGFEMGGEVVDFERAAHRLSLGLSTSRNWSPTRLMAMMVTSRAMPG